MGHEKKKEIFGSISDTTSFVLFPSIFYNVLINVTNKSNAKTIQKKICQINMQHKIIFQSELF